MQIVIDIPEDAYYNFMLLGKKINNVEERQIIQAFENGAPYEDRPTGHWIIVQGMNEQCSNCKKFFPLLDFKCRPFEINYCPNCGAHMVESEVLND